MLLSKCFVVSFSDNVGLYAQHWKILNNEYKNIFIVLIRRDATLDLMLTYHLFQNFVTIKIINNTMSDMNLRLDTIEIYGYREGIMGASLNGKTVNIVHDQVFIRPVDSTSSFWHCHVKDVNLGNLKLKEY